MARLKDITGRKVLLEASGLKGGRVLDVGMGECACMSFFLAQRGFDVTGIDRSPKAIHEARLDADRKRCKGAFAARRADANRLPFENAVFDAVVCYHALHHMDDPEHTIGEMFRVCKPGGMVLIADLNGTGRKLYKHKADCDGLLERIERRARGWSAAVRIMDTRLDRLMVFSVKESARHEEERQRY